MAQGLFLKTFRDLIEHLVDWSGAIPSTAEMSKPRRAVLAAYRKLFYDNDWRYFHDDQRVVLQAPYATGTVVYDHTGGTYERMLTLTGGTWPTTAAWCRITIGTDEVIYKVSDRKSATVITLDSTFNPGADVASSAFNLFRTEYPLPEVHRLYAINDESGYWSARYVPADQWQDRQRNWLTSGPPFYWTITGDSDYFGAMMLRVTGYPTERETLDFLCCRKPRRLVIDGIATAWNAGTISSATGTSVVVSGNTFSNEVVNAVVRLSRTAAVPTDVEGGNAYIDQRIITAVSGSTITVDDTIDTAGVAVGTKYCISDPVDLPDYLYDLLLAWSEYEYARMSIRERLIETKALLDDARREARKRDKYIETPTIQSPWNRPEWALLSGTIGNSIPADYFTSGWNP